MIPPEVEAKILRLHRVEGWPVGTIARELGIHHEVVSRVLAQAGIPRPKRLRPSRIDPFVPFIQETWAKYPALPASRLYRMCRERGYVGSADHFRHAVARYRPQRPVEAFLRLRTLPGEQAQVDWGHFGKLQIGRAVHPLMAFVMVLSHSRAMFLRFFLSQRIDVFLCGHQAAFEHFRGCARTCLYDNLKSAVLERVGDAIRYNPQLLALAAHYGFEVRAVAPGRGNEEPRVERAIRFVRTSFFLARTWRDIEDLNAQALEWCRTEVLERRWPEDPARTVGDIFEEERKLLLPLPANPHPVEERREVAVGRTPYVRFDRNDYSVPHAFVRQVLTVLATESGVRILHDTEEVARHRRSYDKGAQIEDPAHIEALVALKARARRHRAMDRLAYASPSSRLLLEALAERGKNLGQATLQLVRLLDAHGAEALERAIQEVLGGSARHVAAVGQVLERNRAAAGRPPATALPLPEDPRVKGLVVRPHALSDYDQLARDDHPEKGGDDEPQTEAPVAR